MTPRPAPRLHWKRRWTGQSSGGSGHREQPHTRPRKTNQHDAMSKLLEPLGELVVAKSVMKVISERDRGDGVHNPDRTERDEDSRVTADSDGNGESTRHDRPSHAQRRYAQGGVDVRPMQPVCHSVCLRFPAHSGIHCRPDFPAHQRRRTSQFTRGFSSRSVIQPGSANVNARNRGYGTSNAKTAPVAGALKIAATPATPAAAPATSKIYWSALGTRRAKRRWTKAPIDAPRYCDRPALPRRDSRVDALRARYARATHS